SRPAARWSKVSPASGRTPTRRCSRRCSRRMIVGHFSGDPEPVRGRDAYVARIAQFLQLLPVLRLEVAEYATNGEVHFIRWTGRATGAKGPVELSGIDRIRVQDVLFTENFVVF